MSDNIVIIAAARTAVGHVGGNLNSLPATASGATVVRALMEGTGVASDQMDQVILDQVSTAGTGKNPAYQTTLNAGPLHQVPAMTIDEVCGSSLKALHQAMHAITCGGSQIVIAGGRKSMNQTAHGLPRSRKGQRLGNRPLVETVIVDGLWVAFNQIHLGVSAEHIARGYGCRRRVLDAFVAASRPKAAAAIKSGRFSDDSVPASIQQRKDDPLSLDQDEFPRTGTTTAALGKLECLETAVIVERH